MQIIPINNNDTNFKAKFYAYPNTLNNIKYLELFEERTSKYPSLILKQNMISHYGNDHFQLFDDDENNPNIISHGFFSFTRNRPENIDDFVSRLTEIFDTLYKNPVPEMHEDII